MTSYRFCRPDDIPWLVRALNECHHPHFPDLSPATVEAFRREVRELSVWPSNCMVASEGEVPIAVLIATKREREVLIHRVGVRPGWERKGHGSHLLTSLSQKLAVLGPPWLIAEVPEALPGVKTFFHQVGYEEEGVPYTDYRRPFREEPPVPEGLVLGVPAVDILEHGGLEISSQSSWERAQESLEATRDQLQGLAVVSPERIEACLLYRGASDSSVGAEILAAGIQGGAQAEVLQALLIRALAETVGGELLLPRLAPGEMAGWDLGRLGFHAGDRYHRLRARAAAA
jgi:GNAT superfamily N-acetyltransferase